MWRIKRDVNESYVNLLILISNKYDNSDLNRWPMKTAIKMTVDKVYMSQALRKGGFMDLCDTL